MTEKTKTGEELEETKIPADPIPPSNADTAPIPLSGQIVQALINDCYIMEFDGDPSTAAEIVKIIEEKEATKTINEDATPAPDPIADTVPAPPSSDGPDYPDTNIFRALKHASYNATSKTPDLSKQPVYGPATTNRPPDNGVFSDIANFRLDSLKKPE